MFKSFCMRQQRGEFDLAGRDELWRLLVTITLRKARNAAKAERREKRDVRRERNVTTGDDADSHLWRWSRWRPPTRRPLRPWCSTRRSSAACNH